MAGRRGARVVSRKRTMVWFGLDLPQTTIAANTKVLVLALNAAELAMRPFTIVRSRWLVNFESDQTVSSEKPAGAIGGIVTSDQASTASVIPGPVSDPDGDWFVWEPLIAGFLFADATGFVDPSGYVAKIDSKAMRKVGLNEDVRIMVENGEAFGAIVNIQGRMLVKLH